MGQDTHGALWTRAVENNTTLPRSLLEEQGRKIHNLGMALGYHILPTKLLNAVEAAGILENTESAAWMASMACLDQDFEWEAIFSWRKQLLGREAALEELRHTLKMCGKGPYSSRPEMKALMIAILDTHPGLVKSLEEDALLHETLLDLTLIRSKTNWVEEGGVDERRMIHLARTSGFFGKLTIRENGIAAMEQWLDKGQRRKHFQAMRDEDRAERAILEDWMAQWIPGEVFGGSPLETWCNSWQDTARWQGQNPTYHALFDVLEPHRRERLSNEHVAEHWRKFGNVWMDQEVNVGDLIRWASGESMDLVVLGNYLDPLVFALMGRSQDADRVMKTPEGAARAQDLMALDGRVWKALQPWTGGQVMEWILREPSWHSWRDLKGDSLLDLWLDTDSKVSIDVDLIMALAETCPELLTHKNRHGQTALARLPVDAEGKSWATRWLLGQNLEKTEPPKERKLPRM